MFVKTVIVRENGSSHTYGDAPFRTSAEALLDELQFLYEEEVDKPLERGFSIVIN